MKTKQSVPVLIPCLIVISVIFIGILIFTYVATKRANPQMIRVGQTSHILRLEKKTDHERRWSVLLRS